MIGVEALLPLYTKAQPWMVGLQPTVELRYKPDAPQGAVVVFRNRMTGKACGALESMIDGVASLPDWLGPRVAGVAQG